MREWGAQDELSIDISIYDLFPISLLNSIYIITIFTKFALLAPY